ncbi:MAG: hypothetical protein AAB631_00030 [Patescibacteria group bacterium]
MTPFYKSPLTYIVIGLLLSVAVVAQAQFWTPPPADFPAGNVYVPVTTGSSTQYKQGTLRLDYLQLSTTTGVAQNALTFPYNRGIVGLDASNRAQSIIYPYAGAPWGLFLSNRNIAGSGGVITLLSTQTGSQSRLQLYPDGRITTVGTFVLPNTATTSLPATARVPGALVYTNGSPYFYKNATEGWLPIGSGSGGGSGAGWMLVPSGSYATPSVLYATSTSRSVKVGINTVAPVAELDIRGDVQINGYNFDPNFFSDYFYQKTETGKSDNTYNPTSVTFDTFRNDPKFILLNHFQQAGATWDTYRITLAKTGGNVGATKACEDNSLTEATPSCSASQYDATNDPTVSPNEVYELGVTSDWNGGYQLQFIKYVKTRVDGKGGGSLTVGGAFSAGSINSPRMLALNVGWNALRWIGSSMTVSQIRTEINKSKGSISNSALAAIYRVNLDTSAYIGPLADTELIQPGYFIVIRLTARKNVTTLPVEYAPEWTLNTGALTIGNVTADSNSITAPMVKGTTGICIGADCRIGWPSGGGGGGVWSTSTTGGIIYYNSGPVGIGTANPADTLSVRGSTIGLNDPDSKWGVQIGETGNIGQNRLDFRFIEQAPGTQEMLFYGGDGTTNYKMGTFAVQANDVDLRVSPTGGLMVGGAVKIAANPTNDEALRIDRAGVVNPVQFRMGTAGGLGDLVIATNAKDTLFAKDGKVGIGGSPTERLEVTRGDLKVSIDSNAPSGYHYIYDNNGGTPGFNTDPNLQCSCDTSSATADLSDCGNDFYRATSYIGGFCYNNAQSATLLPSPPNPPNTYAYSPARFKYNVESDSVSFSGGSGVFENKISIGKPTVIGAIPKLYLNSDGGKYSIENRGGTLQFSNASNIKTLTLGQDGMLNLKVRQEADYRYGLLVTADSGYGAMINTTKALAVNTTLDSSDRFVVYGNGDVRAKGNLTLGADLGTTARNTVVSSKVYTFTIGDMPAQESTWQNIIETGLRGIYLIAVNGMRSTTTDANPPNDDLDDNSFPVGLWVCAGARITGGHVCDEITPMQTGEITTPWNGACMTEGIQLAWPNNQYIQARMYTSGFNYCSNIPTRFNISVIKF